MLLDTQVWLWMLAAPERLADGTRELLALESTVRLVSAASVWEIAVKHRLGKLPLTGTPEAVLPALMKDTRATPLAVEHSHALRVGALPMHHRDPFDRLLIAQAQIEGVPLLTVDRQMSAYDVKVLAP